MIKKWIAIVTVLVLVFVSFYSIFGTVDAQKTLYVDDNFNSSTQGWGVTHFDKIQDAIDAADDGDTIIVYAGTYYENVVVNKGVTIEAGSNPVIDGGGSGTVVKLSADNVELNGFEIRNSGAGATDAGIAIESNNNIILNDRITGNNIGIYVGEVEASGWSTVWDDSTDIGGGSTGIDFSDDEVITCHYNRKIVVRDAEDGSSEWTTDFGPVSGYTPSDVAFDSDNNIGVVGSRHVGGYMREWHIEYYDRTSDSPKWTKTEFYGINTFAGGCAFDSSGNLVVAGRGGSNYPTVKSYKANDGSQNWKWDGPDGYDWGVGYGAICIDSNDNVFAGGKIQGDDYQAQITKLDKNGNHQWSKTLGTNQNSVVMAIGTDSNGDVLAIINEEKKLEYNLYKYSSSGSFLWDEIDFGSDENFKPYSKSLESYDSDKWMIYGYSDTNSKNMIYFIDKDGDVESKYYTDITIKDGDSRLAYDPANNRIALASHTGEGTVWSTVLTPGVTIPSTANNNIITNNIYGVYMDSTACALNHNDIYGNTYGVENTVDSEADLEFNWWGDASGPGSSGPGIGDSISANVDYSPWLGYVEGTSPMTFHTNDVIQDAVEESVGGDTVLVYDGTYTEQIVIDHDLTLSTASKPKIVAPVVKNAYTLAESGSLWEPIVFAYGGTETDGHISGTGTISVSITGFEIDGANRAASGKRFAAILCRNVNTGEIHQNEIHDMYDGDGKGDGPQTFGIIVYGNSNVDIIGNDIRDFSRGGIGANGDWPDYPAWPIDIDLYPDPVVNIQENMVFGNGLEGETDWWAENGIQVGYGAFGTIKYNEVSDCRVNDDYWAASGIIIYVANVDFISENIVDDCDLGIPIYYSENGEINHNDLVDNDYGFDVYQGSDNLFHHNSIETSVFTGMYLESSSNNIHHNVFDLNGDAGIFLDGCTKNNIHHNKFNINDAYGIYLIEADSNSFSKNHAFRNGLEGMRLEGADGNTISSNNLRFNSEYGLRITDLVDGDTILETSDNNKITKNNIQHNDVKDIYSDTTGTGNTYSKNVYDTSEPEIL